MKKPFMLSLSLIMLLTIAACGSTAGDSMPPTPTHEPRISSISVAVGSSVFTVVLHDNETAKALSALLPMTMQMSELNGNEKYFYLPDDLPADPQQVGSISAGDLMLYGADCLVLFYEGLSTAHSYTSVGYIQDASGLADALGSGEVEVMLMATQ